MWVPPSPSEPILDPIPPVASIEEVLPLTLLIHGRADGDAQNAKRVTPTTAASVIASAFTPIVRHYRIATSIESRYIICLNILLSEMIYRANEHMTRSPRQMQPNAHRLLNSRESETLYQADLSDGRLVAPKVSLLAAVIATTAPLAPRLVHSPTYKTAPPSRRGQIESY